MTISPTMCAVASRKIPLVGTVRIERKVLARIKKASIPVPWS